MSFKRGDIVDIPVPFKDNPNLFKERPALILSKGELAEGLYAITPFSSSAINETVLGVLSVQERSKGWPHTNLTKGSYLQVYRVTTIDKKFIIRKRGHFLSRMFEVDALLKQVLGIPN